MKISNLIRKYEANSFWFEDFTGKIDFPTIAREIVPVTMTTDDTAVERDLFLSVIAVFVAVHSYWPGELCVIGERSRSGPGVTLPAGLRHENTIG